MHSKDSLSLFHSVWDLSWEYLEVGGLNRLQAYSLTCLAGDAGCGLQAQLGLSAETPTCGLFCMGYFELPQSMAAVFQEQVSQETVNGSC